MAAVTDRASWRAMLDDLLVEMKAHTREGDAIAALAGFRWSQVDPVDSGDRREHGQVLAPGRKPRAAAS